MARVWGVPVVTLIMIYRYPSASCTTVVILPPCNSWRTILRYVYESLIDFKIRKCRLYVYFFLLLRVMHSHINAFCRCVLSNNLYCINVSIRVSIYVSAYVSAYVSKVKLSMWFDALLHIPSLVLEFVTRGCFGNVHGTLVPRKYTHVVHTYIHTNIGWCSWNRGEGAFGEMCGSFEGRRGEKCEAYHVHVCVHVYVNVCVVDVRQLWGRAWWGWWSLQRACIFTCICTCMCCRCAAA